jgi:hypothetical protein
MNSKIDPKCHFCDRCDGHGCVSELPGMGGVYANENFIRNCAEWDRFAAPEGPLPAIRLAPITGASQNVGYAEEGPFYGEIVRASLAAGIALSIGDGYPDEKIRFGIAALAESNARGAVFIKPYENARIIERMEWARGVASLVGVDIDSYAILTMRNLVNLEKKDARSLLELKSRAASCGIPFAIKGVFRPEDVDLVAEVRPDVTVISNHGGRVETLKGSTAEFLCQYGKTLKAASGSLWVDGGLRKRRDLLVAASFGVSEVMIGRPLITALIRSGPEGVERLRVELLGY